MNEAKREVAALLASVVDFPVAEAGEPKVEAFERWELYELISTEFFTAVSFTANAGTDWRSFDRDVTVAPKQGEVMVQYREDLQDTASRDHPVLVPAKRTARYIPTGLARGVLIFIPTIIDENDA